MTGPIHRCYAIALVLLLFTTKSLATSGEIKLLTVEYPPYVGLYLNNKGPFYQLVKEAYQAAGYKVRIKFTPWVGAIDKVKPIEKVLKINNNYLVMSKKVANHQAKLDAANRSLAKLAASGRLAE